MKTSLMYCLVALTFKIIVASAATCAPSDPAFVCGLQNAEDLVRLPGTPWIIASHLPGEDGFGPLEAVRIDTHEVRRLYPTSNAIVEWDRRNYPDCETPPENMSSHGLNVRVLADNNYRLYVVNHGGRESIEVIDVVVRDSQPSTTWRGCIHAPEGSSLNGVAPLPEDGVAVAGSSVALWRPSKGWVKIEGIKGAAGVEVSRDGQWLLVAVYLDNSVVRVPIAGGAAQTVFKGNFFTDNLRWGEDGYLYVAGHQSLAECWKTKALICDVGFAVAQIDPATLSTKEIVRSNGIQGVFGSATVALQVDDSVWIGSCRGDRVSIFSRNQ